VNGFVVEPGSYQQIAERINHFIENNIFIDMGNEGRKKAMQMFSCEEIVAQHHRFYQQIS